MKVLVIEDEEMMAKTLGAILTREGHEVAVLCDGRAGLERIRSEAAAGAAFQVVFCDLMLGSITGMDIHEAIRADGKGLEARFVFMTGGAYVPAAAEFLERVPNRRLEKPFLIKDVRTALADAATAAAAGG